MTTRGRLVGVVVLLCGVALGLYFLAFGLPADGLSWPAGRQAAGKTGNYPLRLTLPATRADEPDEAPPGAEPQASPGLAGPIAGPADALGRAPGADRPVRPAAAQGAADRARRASSEPQGTSFARAFSEFAEEQAGSPPQPRRNVDLLASKFRLENARRASPASGETQ